MLFRSVNDIIARMKKPAPKYTTVATFIKILEDIFLELTEDVTPTQPEKHKLFSKRKKPEMSDAAAQQTEASEEEAQPGEEKKTVTTKEAESYASHL